MTKEELRKFFDAVHIDSQHEEKFTQDVIMAEDGYYVYWPEGTGGFLTEYDLLELAAYLNKKNREWDDGVDEFFKC